MQIINNIQQKESLMKSFTDGASADMKYLVPCNMPNPDTDWHVCELFCEIKGKKTTSCLQVVGWMPLSSSTRSKWPIYMASVQKRWKNKGRAYCLIFVRLPPQRYLQLGWDWHFLSSCTLKRALYGKIGFLGTEVLKEWFNVLLTCSTMGIQEKLWIMGKAKWPPSFPRYLLSDLQKHCIYRYNMKAWMMSTIFLENMDVTKQ